MRKLRMMSVTVAIWAPMAAGAVACGGNTLVDGGPSASDFGLGSGATDGAGGTDQGSGVASDSASADGPGPGGATLCADLAFTTFDKAVSSFLSVNGLRGASAVVVHRGCGVVHTQGYGQYPADRVYLVGSSSKVVSVGVLMRLADQGLVDLDAPVGQHLGAWEPNGKPELVLAQMLSNSSGLVGLVDSPLYRPYACQYRDTGMLSDCARAIYTADDALTRVLPDTSFHYGGGQWQLAGGVAEVVSGKSWATLIKETYLDSCGLPSLGYTNQFAKATLAGTPFGYPPFFDGDVATLPSTENPSVEGGMFINVSDYGKILLMHLRGGICDGVRVLSEQAVKRMQSDRILVVYGGSTAGQTGRLAGGESGAGVDGGVTAGATFAGYGLGWWIDRNHAGVVADPGLYGAFPWLDLGRGYGALIAIEADGNVGATLFAAAKPVLDNVFDSAHP